MKNQTYKLNLEDCIVLENARRIAKNIPKIKDLKDLSRKIVFNDNSVKCGDFEKRVNTVYVNLYRAEKNGFSSLASKESLIFDVLCILKVKREELVVENLG
jgi:hypothetical protein